jgi:hypothetical protein
MVAWLIGLALFGLVLVGLLAGPALVVLVAPILVGLWLVALVGPFSR